MRTFNPLNRSTFILLLLPALMAGQAASAQNPGNQGTRTYDTALTSDGFGIYHLQIPQFNPDSGTLMSVHISALTNTMYGFTLRNADSLSSTYSLTVGIQDEFSGPALPSTYANVTSQSLGNFPLNAGQEVTQAPVSLLPNHISTDTVSAVTNFLGTGQVNLNYQAFTFTNLSAVNHAAYYYSAGIANTMSFSVQYVFSKSTAILPADLTSWSAVPIGARRVQLDWTASDETTGRQYVIQRSTNSSNFQDIAAIPASADRSTAQYHYPDELPQNSGNAANESWYYRLQIQDATGQVTYSQIRVVNLFTTTNTVQVYPNPATDFINLAPDQRATSDWQVDILSAAGTLVQREVFMQSRLMTVNFHSRMAAGTYFVRATDLRGQQTITSTFIVP
jgi:hypothetical protein